MAEPTPQPGQETAAPKTENPTLRPATPEELEQAKTEAKSFGEELQTKKEEYQKKVDSLFNIVESKGMGNAEARQLASIQKAEIERVAKEKLAKYNAMPGLEERKAQRAGIINEAQAEFAQIYQPLDRIINFVRGVDHLDDKEFVKLKAFLTAEAKMKVNPESEKLFGKILTKEKLTPGDFDYIYGLCQEILPGQLEQKTEQVFEASQAGALIGSLSDAQKMDFVRHLAKTKYPAEEQKVRGIIEALYTHQVLSNDQLQNLAKEFPGNLGDYFQKILTDPDFQKHRQEYEQFLKRQQLVSEGRGAENPLNKLWGMPGLYLLATLWGSATAFVNLGVNFDSKDIPGSLERFFTGWGGVGLGAATIGGLGIGSHFSPELNNLLGRIFHPSSIKVSAEQREQGELDAARSSIYYQFGKNPELAHFFSLNYSGSQTVFEKIQSYINEHSKDDPKLEKLDFHPLIEELAKSSQSEVSGSLEKSISAARNKDSFALLLKDLFAKFQKLKVENSAGFKKFFADYNQNQGITR